jgi:hypothetical protein
MKRWIVVAVVAMVAAFLSTPAHATIEIKITDGTNSVDILDGGAGDSCAAVNCVTFNGTIGQWDINVDTGTSKGAASPNLMDLAYLAHHTGVASGGTTLTITLSDDGFAPLSPGFTEQIGGTQSAGGTLTAKLFGGNSNSKFDMSQQDGPTFTTTVSPYAFSASGANPGAVSPYSLTQVLTLSYGNATGLTTGDWSVTFVPEPASVAMFGGVLLATFGAIRRRMRRSL